MPYFSSLGAKDTLGTKGSLAAHLARRLVGRRPAPRESQAPRVSERDLSAKLSAALLVAKFSDIHIEKLEEVTLSFTKYQSTLLPIILFRNAGPDKNESRQKFILFKSRRESMRVHECLRPNDSENVNFRHLDIKI